MVDSRAVQHTLATDDEDLLCDLDLDLDLGLDGGSELEERFCCICGILVSGIPGLTERERRGGHDSSTIVRAAEHCCCRPVSTYSLVSFWALSVLRSCSES